MNPTPRWSFAQAVILSCSLITLAAFPAGAKSEPTSTRATLSNTEVSAEVSSLPISEASGIAALPGGRFLIVDDEKGIILLNASGVPKVLSKAKEDKHLWDLEGICLSTDRKFVYCLAERKGTITRLPLKVTADTVDFGKVEKLGKLPEIGKNSGKGWEGICVYWNNGRDQLVAVHQKNPRSLGLFDLPTLEPVAIKELPYAVTQKLETLSDVTFDQRSGHLILLGGQSQQMVEIDFLGGKELSTFTVSNCRALPLAPEERPEGICFDGSDRLVVVTDGGGVPGKILRFKH